MHPGAEDIVYHHSAYMHRRRDLHFIQKPHGLLHHILGDLAVRLYRQAASAFAAQPHGGGDYPGGVLQLIVTVLRTRGQRLPVTV